MNPTVTFRRLAIGESVSLFGNFVTSFALPFTAVQLLQANAVEVGVLTALTWLPFLLFGLLAGVYVDQRKKVPILVFCNLARGIILCVIPLAWMMGILNIGLLLDVAFLHGSFGVLHMAALPVLVPELVGRNRLVESNAKLEVGSSIAQSVAPTIAGFLVQIIAAPVVIVLDSISFLIAGISTFSIRRSETRAITQVASEGVLSRIRQGFAFIARDKRLSVLFVVGIFASLSGAVHNAVFLLFAIRELSLTALEIGFMSSIQGVGTVLGAIVVSRISRRIDVGKTILLGGAIFICSAIIKPLLPSEPHALTVLGLSIAQFLAGVSNPLWTVSILSFRQAITPSEILGRVSATVRTAVMGSIPLGALLGGVLGDALSLRAGLVAAAGFITIAWMLVALSPIVKFANIAAVKKQM